MDTREQKIETLTDMVMAVAGGGHVDMTLKVDDSDNDIIKVEVAGAPRYWEIDVNTAEQLAKLLSDEEDWGPDDMFVMTLKVFVGMAKSADGEAV